MLYDMIPRRTKRRRAATMIACRNIELVAVTGLAGLAAGWHASGTVGPAVSGTVLACIFGALALGFVALAMRLRAHPPRMMVNNILDRLPPKQERKMLSRPALFGAGILALGFGE